MGNYIFAILGIINTLSFCNENLNVTKNLAIFSQTLKLHFCVASAATLKPGCLRMS